MNLEDINILLSGILTLAAFAAAFSRENPYVLDAIARWAASRAYGIRCAAAESERRRQLEVEQL